MIPSVAKKEKKKIEATTLPTGRRPRGCSKWFLFESVDLFSIICICFTKCVSVTGASYEDDSYKVTCIRLRTEVHGAVGEAGGRRCLVGSGWHGPGLQGGRSAAQRSLPGFLFPSAFSVQSAGFWYRGPDGSVKLTSPVLCLCLRVSGPRKLPR